MNTRSYRLQIPGNMVHVKIREVNTMEYSKGLTWRSIIALLFAVIMLEPAVIYYYLVSGETMPLSVWIMILLWVEVSSIFGAQITKQEVFIMMTFEWVGLWSSTWLFLDLLKRFYFANSEIAKIFNETADILEIQGAIIFRVRAYRNAARVIDNLPEKLSDIVARNPDELNSIKSIGKALHDKIIEFCQTGKIKEFDDLKSSLPPGLLDMLKIQSFGPKRVKLVYNKLGIDSVDKLEKAASEGKIRALPGMGEKSELKILKSIRDFRTLQTDRKLWAEAEQILDDYLNYLKKIDGIDKIEPAGSFRRRRETVGDLDILITCSGDTEKIIRHFAEYPEVLEILAQGETKSSVVLKDKIQEWRIDQALNKFVKLGYLREENENVLSIGWRTYMEINIEKLVKSLATSTS